MAKEKADAPEKPKKKKRKLLRVLMAGMFLAAIALGGVYGLAKAGRISLPTNPKLAPLYAKIGLKPKHPPSSASQVANKLETDPLADERRALSVMRESLQKEREDWERLKQAQEKKAAEPPPAAKASPPPQNAIDPKALARMATIYEEMPVEKLNKIFTLLPDDEVIQLLRRMEEKKVADILAAEKPARAARLSLILSKSPKESASAK